jgi:CRP-like cAMP-binding protein
VILSNEAYTDTATALEDSLLCLIPKDLIEQLINLYPDVAREFIKLLSNNIREKEDQLLQLAYQSVRKKMAVALLRLFNLQTDKNPNIRISREDLAAMAGMATETVSRTLSDFKEEGLIEKKASTITLIDLVSLGKMKN